MKKLLYPYGPEWSELGEALLQLLVRYEGTEEYPIGCQAMLCLRRVVMISPRQNQRRRKGQLRFSAENVPS